MHTIEFLKSSTLDELCQRFSVRARRHAIHPNLVQLKYNQILSPMDEPIVRECRGLILDEGDGWRVVARSYDKFFNLGEPNADAIDWSTAKVYEKLDGSLMTVYHYRGQWHVASSGAPDAAGPAHDAGVTFADLFRRTWASLGYRWPSDASSHLCFMFELMTPENRIIVAQREPRIVLHGVRDLRSMREVEPEAVAHEHGWACTRTLPLTCVDDCLAAANVLSPLEAEGYVVRDAAFRRVKVKSPQYVALTHLKSMITGRRLLEIVRANESEEFLAYFPEFRPAYDAVRGEYDRLCDALEADYRRLRGIADRKAFATEACKTRCSSPLFAMHARKCATVRDFFATATIQSLERAIGIDLSTLVEPQQEELEQ